MAAAAEKQQDSGIGVNEFMNTMAQVMKDAMKQGVQEINPHRNNPNFVENSWQHPAGVEKEKLTRRVLFKGLPQDDNMLTPEEVHLFNQIQAPIDVVIQMAGMPKHVTVRQENKGTIPDLSIDFPLSIEERAYMPSLTKILRALIAGVDVIE